MSENFPLSPELHTGESRQPLQADCENCFGLCCVALPFSASADFAMDKAAGQACPNLQSDFRCGVHNSLRQLGLRGCTVYDCFGAGQKVSLDTYGGSDWRQSPGSAKQMFELFPIMRQLHEMLWYLTEAMTYQPALPIRKELGLALAETQRLTNLDPSAIMGLDIPAHRAVVNTLLLRTSELVRGGVVHSRKSSRVRRKPIGPGADLMGAKLEGADLKAANLRGAYLIAADLRNADLRMADLIGADFRDADLKGADLRESIFLTQVQINAAKGNASTKLPPVLSYPTHWSTTGI